MREKIYDIINKIYGILMTTAFFGGLIPLIPFVIAIIIGGPQGEAMAIFIQKQVYPWIIALASTAVLLGWIAMCIEKKDEDTDDERFG